MSEQEAIRKFNDPKWRINNLYYIIDKQGKKVKFKLNWAQEELYQNMWYCNVILKARQLGISTLVCLYFSIDVYSIPPRQLASSPIPEKMPSIFSRGLSLPMTASMNNSRLFVQALRIVLENSSLTMVQVSEWVQACEDPRSITCTFLSSEKSVLSFPKKPTKSLQDHLMLSLQDNIFLLSPQLKAVRVISMIYASRLKTVENQEKSSQN